MSLVSVVVPVYNSEKYLKRCIDSIMQQSFRDFELILIDDGSTDNSGMICDRYANEIKDTVIKVIHQTNRGQAHARNVGVEHAEGKWITFIDSDDYIHHQMLEIMYNALIGTDARISMCGALFDADHEKLELCDIDNVNYHTHEVNEEFFNNMTKSKWSECEFKNEVVWAKLIDKDIVLEIPFTEGRIYEDIAIVCYWLDMAKIVVDCNNKLYFYNDNPNGTINSVNLDKRLDRLWGLEMMENFYLKHKYYSMVKKVMQKFFSEITEMEEAFDSFSKKEQAILLKRRRRKKVLFYLININWTLREKYRIVSQYW